MTITTETGLLPEVFTPPLINPRGGGLFAATNWTEQDGPPRWLGAGMAFRRSVTGNFGGDSSSGVWGASWCASPDELGADDVKDGARPDDPDAFTAVTTWAFDSCDLSAPSQAEVADRARQVLRMREPVLVAAEFASRITADAGTPASAGDLVAAVAEVEDALAEANVQGYIHVGPRVLPALVAGRLVFRTETGLRTASGNAVVVDGGYRETLGADLLVATSAPLGWRTQVDVTTSEKPEHNIFVALAERSVVVGVEAVLGAAKVSA